MRRLNDGFGYRLDGKLIEPIELRDADRSRFADCSICIGASSMS